MADLMQRRLLAFSQIVPSADGLLGLTPDGAIYLRDTLGKWRLIPAFIDEKIGEAD